MKDYFYANRLRIRYAHAATSLGLVLTQRSVVARSLDMFSRSSSKPIMPSSALRMSVRRRGPLTCRTAQRLGVRLSSAKRFLHASTKLEHTPLRAALSIKIPCIRR